MLMARRAVGPREQVHTFFSPNSIDSYPIITLTWTRCSFAVVKKRDGLGKVDGRAQCEQRNIHGLQTPTGSGEFSPAFFFFFSLRTIYSNLLTTFYSRTFSLLCIYIYISITVIAGCACRRSRSTHLQSRTRDQWHCHWIVDELTRVFGKKKEKKRK